MFKSHHAHFKIFILHPLHYYIPSQPNLSYHPSYLKLQKLNVKTLLRNHSAEQSTGCTTVHYVAVHHFAVLYTFHHISAVTLCIYFTYYILIITYSLVRILLVLVRILLVLVRILLVLGSDSSRVQFRHVRTCLLLNYVCL